MLHIVARLEKITSTIEANNSRPCGTIKKEAAGVGCLFSREEIVQARGIIVRKGRQI